uniref:Uncharacterized protein n=1 Tax=Engystomops pustulosus TaxID=76066 RepID=A0AAV6YZC1_ENGPU|nr:hypothetical protein GDO81_021435 [Engystomops pustulosus]
MIMMEMTAITRVTTQLSQFPCTFHCITYYVRQRKPSGLLDKIAIPFHHFEHLQALLSQVCMCSQNGASLENKPFRYIKVRWHSYAFFWKFGCCSSTCMARDAQFQGLPFTSESLHGIIGVCVWGEGDVLSE